MASTAEKHPTCSSCNSVPRSLMCVDCVWNVMAHARNPVFVFRQNGRVHLNRRGRQFGRLPAAEVCASAVVMLDTPCSEVVGRVLAMHSICQFPLHFPSCASPCAITFQLDSTPHSNDYFCNEINLVIQKTQHPLQPPLLVWTQWIITEFSVRCV
jgi:hypothetical protein